MISKQYTEVHEDNDAGSQFHTVFSLVFSGLVQRLLIRDFYQFFYTMQVCRNDFSSEE